MSCCYSYSIVDLVREAEQTKKNPSLPFAFFYGYNNETQAGTVQDETKFINESFLNDGGRYLMENMEKMHIKRFSEFDYMYDIITFIFYEYKIGETREKLVLGLPKECASVARKVFNECFRDNPLKLIKALAQTIIQNPERREIYLDCIEKQISHISQKEN